MAEVRGIRALLSRKYTMREMVLAVLTVLTLASALVYRFPYTAVVNGNTAIRGKIDAARKDLQTLSLQIADLGANAARIREAAKSGIRWDLADQQGVLLVLQDVSSEARQEGVDLVAVHPSQEISKKQYKEVSMTLDLKGKYREMAEYFKRIESSSRIVNIRKIRVDACPDASSSCATQLQAVTYVEK